MQRYQKFIFFLFCLPAIVLLNGCIDKTIRPEAAIEISTVTPYELTTTATDTASLPTTAITVNSINTVPCNLKSYSVTYFSRFGEIIPSLSIPSTPIDLKLAAAGTIDVTVRPYTSRVVDMFELSNSDISPIQAKINLVFEDYNSNIINKEAHCLIYKPNNT